MIEERFFQVRITADAQTTVRVSAVDSDQACQRAMVRVPALGQGWEIKRTRAEIINVSRVSELSESGEPCEGEDHDHIGQ